MQQVACKFGEHLRTLALHTVSVRKGEPLWPAREVGDLQPGSLHAIHGGTMGLGLVCMTSYVTEAVGCVAAERMERHCKQARLGSWCRVMMTSGE